MGSAHGRVVALAAIALVTGGLGAHVTLRGQSPAGPSHTAASGVLAGRVIDADTHTAVPGARVQLAGAGLAQVGTAGQAAGGGPRVIEADPAGRFLFTELPKGSFSLVATAAGYLGGRYGEDRPPAPISRTLDTFRTVDLADGETKTDVTLLMWHQAVITGTVLDENGDPMVGVSVHVDPISDIWIGRLRGGGGLLVPATDDRGIYRQDVTPGDYVVSVGATVTSVPAQVMDQFRTLSTLAERQAASAQMVANGVVFAGDGRGLHLGDRVLLTDGPTAAAGYALPIWMGPGGGPLFAYPVTYYSGAATADAATVVSVKSGEERDGVDFQLRPQATFKISGHVIGPFGPVVGAGVRLAGPDWDKTTSYAGNAREPAAVTDAEGAFSLFGIPAGSYIVDVAKVPIAARDMTASIAMSSGGGGGTTVIFGGPPRVGPPSTDPILWAAQPLIVGAGDVADLTVAATSGGRISGHVEVVPAGQLTSQQLRIVSIDVRPVPGFTPARFFTPNMVSVLDDAGTFRSSQLVPGKYVIQSGRMPPGWQLKSAMVNGTDAADDPIDLEPSGVTDMVVTITNQPTTLTGTVAPEETPSPAAGTPRTLTVVAFPTDARYWPKYAYSPRRLRTAGVSATLTYAISGLPAGEYFVAASSSAVDFTDPKVLAFLAQTAPRVTLVEGEARSLGVRAAPIPPVR